MTYVVDDQGSPVVVTQWLDGALLRPARLDRFAPATRIDPSH